MNNLYYGIMRHLKLQIALIFLIGLIEDIYAQDKLFFTNGKELDVKIQRETLSEIYFVKSTEQDSVRYMISKSDLKQINYMNGDSAVFKSVQKPAGVAIIQNERTGIPNAAYNAWIYNDLSLTYKTRKGFILSVSDSGIVFSVSATGNKFLIKDRMSEYILAENIDKIKIRRKGSVGKGILIGGVAGFLIGGIIGLAGGDDPESQGGFNIFSYSAEEKAAIGGILVGIPATIIGGIVSSLRVKIPINKKQIQFQEKRSQVASYADTKTN